MSNTNFIDVDGNDLITVFKPFYSGSVQTNPTRLISNGQDLNEIFAAQIGTDSQITTDTNFITDISNNNVPLDLRYIFMRFDYILQNVFVYDSGGNLQPVQTYNNYNYFIVPSSGYYFTIGNGVTSTIVNYVLVGGGGGGG